MLCCLCERQTTWSKSLAQRDSTIYCKTVRFSVHSSQNIYKIISSKTLEVFYFANIFKHKFMLSIGVINGIFEHLVFVQRKMLGKMF